MNELEKRLRVLQVQALAQWLLIIGLAVSLFQANRAARPTPQREVVRAREFLLVDERGNVLGKWGVSSPGSKPYIRLEGTGNSSVLLGSEVGTGTPNSAFTGLKVMEKDGTQVSVGIAPAKAPLPTASAIGLSIRSVNSQMASLELDAEHRRPNLLMGNPGAGFLDLGVWFVDQRPYLKLFEGGHNRASLFVAPKNEGRLEFSKSGESLQHW